MSKNVIIIAGPNGSGKTTFAREYLRDSGVSEYISAEINRNFFELFMRDIRNGGV